jgi:integrase
LRKLTFILRVLFSARLSAIAEELQEPYSTLVLFLAVTGLRVGEAIAIKWSDFDGDVLSVTRRISNGDLDTVKSESSCRKLPIPSELISRMRQLGEGEWIFRSREGTPVNPGNALKRYVRPVAKELGITIGGVARLSAYADNEHAPWWGTSESDLRDSWTQRSSASHEHLRSSGSGRFSVAATARVWRVVTKCYEIGRSSLNSLRQLIEK